MNKNVKQERPELRRNLQDDEERGEKIKVISGKMANIEKKTQN